jgi:WD40 repeat protein
LPIDSDLSIGAIALAPDGNELAIGLRTGVVIWNYRVKESRFYISDEKCIIASLAISPDGHYLAIRGDSAELWDYQKGQKIGDLPSPNLHSHMSKIKFSPDGKLLVASLNGPINFPSEIGVWQTKDFSRSFLFSCQEDVITSMAFIPGTNTLVTGSSDCSIRLWDLNKISWANEKTEKNKNRQ